MSTFFGAAGGQRNFGRGDIWLMVFVQPCDDESGGHSVASLPTKRVVQDRVHPLGHAGADTAMSSLCLYSFRENDVGFSLLQVSVAYFFIYYYYHPYIPSSWEGYLIDLYCIAGDGRETGWQVMFLHDERIL